MSTTPHSWNVNSAELYEQYLVPALFGPFAERLVALVGPDRGDRVLDVACGTGAVARTAAARGAVVTGTDVNAAMLAVAQRVEPSVDWREGDAVTPVMSDDGYDLVLCQQGLQFLPDRAAGFAAWQRALRPGGRLGVSVWRSIEHQPGYRAFVAALDRVAGEEVGAVMRAPFAGPDREELHTLAFDSGLRDGRVTIDVGSVSFPSVEAFLKRQVSASPLTGPVGALDRERRAALLTEVTDALAPFADDESVTWPMEALVLTAVRTD